MARVVLGSRSYGLGTVMQDVTKCKGIKVVVEHTSVKGTIVLMCVEDRGEGFVPTADQTASIASMCTCVDIVPSPYSLVPLEPHEYTHEPTSQRRRGIALLVSAGDSELHDAEACVHQRIH